MAKTGWNLVTRDGLARLPPYVQYFEYAEAYLDSARRLCTTLALSRKKTTFQRGAVVLYLLQHALELFYKGAILKASPTERFSHGVAMLRSRYEALYPGKSHYVRPFFVTSYVGLNKDEVAQVKRREPPSDQLFRYPENKRGEPWEGLHAFEAASCLREISGLVLEFKKVRSRIAG